MVNKGKLSAVLSGINEGLDDVARSKILEKALKKRAQIKLLEEAQKQELERSEELMGSFKKKDPVEKVQDFVIEKLGDLLGVELEGYRDLKENKIKQDALIESIIKKEKLPKNKETRENIRKTLLSKSAPIDARPFSEKHPVLGFLKENIGDPLVSAGKSLKDVVFQDWTSPQPYKDMGSTILQTPYRLTNHALGLLGAIDEKMAKHGPGTRISPSLSEQLNPSREKLKDIQGGIEEFLGGDPNAKSKQGVEMLTDIVTLPGKALAKGGNLLSRILKNTAIGAAEGAGYGALYGEGDPDAMKQGAILGGTLKGTLGAKKSKGQKLKEEFESIKERATFEDPEMIQRRAELMGKGATIPEVVGDETLINRLKTDTSRENVSRMREIESNLKRSAKELSEELPKGEALDLYKSLEELQTKVSDEAGASYDTVKESGIGKQGILEKNVILEWLKALKNAESNVKGLPKMKLNGPNVKAIEALLQTAPNNPAMYFNFSKQHIGNLPTAGDFLKFRSKIRKMLEKADSSQYEGLSVLLEDLNRIVEKVDPNSTLATANKQWATQVVPTKQKAVKEAIKASTFEEAQKGKPSIRKVFGEQSIENSQLFEMLSTQDKQRVLGAFLDEVVSEGEKHPSRAIMETWKKIPDYIKETSDPAVQKILKQMETMAQTSKTLSSSQSATKVDIGSSLPTKDLTKAVRGWLYAGSIFSGNPSTAALVFGADLAGKGINKIRNKALRKRLGQSNLKYYLHPELLTELEKNRRIPYGAIANREDRNELH